MNVAFSVFVFVLFFVLTPGVLVRLPSKGSKTTVALFHGLLFAIILAVSGHFFWKYKKTVFEGATVNDKHYPKISDNKKESKMEESETPESETPGSKTPGSEVIKKMAK